VEKRENILHGNSPILIGVELNLHERLPRKNGSAYSMYAVLFV